MAIFDFKKKANKNYSFKNSHFLCERSQHHRAEFSGSKDSSCMCKMESMMLWDSDRDQRDALLVTDALS